MLAQRGRRTTTKAKTKTTMRKKRKAAKHLKRKDIAAAERVAKAAKPRPASGGRWHPSRTEMDQRVYVIAKMILAGRSRIQIVRELSRAWDVTQRAMYYYLRRAYGLIEVDAPLDLDKRLRAAISRHAKYGEEALIQLDVAETHRERDQALRTLLRVEAQLAQLCGYWTQRHEVQHTGQPLSVVLREILTERVVPGGAADRDDDVDGRAPKSATAAGDTVMADRLMSEVGDLERLDALTERLPADDAAGGRY